MRFPAAVGPCQTSLPGFVSWPWKTRGVVKGLLKVANLGAFATVEPFEEVRVCDALASRVNLRVSDVEETNFCANDFGFDNNLGFANPFQSTTLASDA